MEGLQLIATGGAVPGRLVTNDDLSRLVDTSDEWITTRTGIRQRHFCGEGESATTLAVTAARQALERSGLDAGQIGCCVCGTLSAEYATPSMACLVQKELGLPQDIPVLDVNAACSGFIYAAAVARGLLAVRPGDARRYALVIGCEQLSRLMDMTDRSTCVLFGDGAGAAIFELVPDAEFAVDLGARGDLAIETPSGGPIRMDGKAVFRFAVDALPRTLHAVLDATHHTLDDVDWVVCHQANSRIIDHCVKKLAADPGKFYKNMDRHGNTSAASIPVALNELAESGRLQPGMRVACIGFGGGLTWGGMLITVKGSTV
ncbi:MAG: 3-oxoacyl-ACP synthase [Subdoligranulum variabile]|nr:MAG: 3-oxoacyl-ACP synthase [Subdoligranulum variabile]